MHIILLSYSVSDSVVGENVDGGYVLYKRLDYFESLKKKKNRTCFFLKLLKMNGQFNQTSTYSEAKKSKD